MYIYIYIHTLIDIDIDRSRYLDICTYTYSCVIILYLCVMYNMKAAPSVVKILAPIDHGMAEATSWDDVDVHVSVYVWVYNI